MFTAGGLLGIIVQSFLNRHDHHRHQHRHHHHRHHLHHHHPNFELQLPVGRVEGIDFDPKVRAPRPARICIIVVATSSGCSMVALFVS